jgi:phosphohistidine phosphatase SixA
MSNINRHWIATAALSLPLWLCAACGTGPATNEPAGGPYVPGLGEIMSLQQMRHTKLWLAGDAGNWELANYEVDELGEGFDDVVAYHPTHKDAPVAPKDAIPRMVTQPLADVRAAIAKKDHAAFVQAYDALTTGCNNCHDAMDFGFNHVQRPATNPYPNQVFAPRDAAGTPTGGALLTALKEGGYALVMRHASSPSETPDRASADPDNSKLERQLDRHGRETAAAMGDAIRALGIPIGHVFTSPTYRARETARLAKLPDPHAQPELGDGGHSMGGVTDAQTAWLRGHVTAWATGTNTVFVTHQPNIAAAFPQWATGVSDGETLVLGPDGNGGIRLVARVPVDAWAGMRP